MSTERSLPKLIILIIAALIILTIMALLVINQADHSRSELPVLGIIPDFEFTERNGVPFGSANMMGKINVVDFMFSNCQTKCPIMVVNMGELYEYYKGIERVQIVSISVDPARDTLATLKAYADEHGVTDDRWVFLRAPVEEVVNISENGFKLAAEGLPMGHTTKFILVDHLGQIRGYYDGMDETSVDKIKTDISKLLQEMP
ncbi:MAG: SCO family protein [Candidatus Zixiibacteriota bacterium]